MGDIALGLQQMGLEAFAARVNASHMSQWAQLGLFDDDVQGWGQAFRQVMNRTIESGAKVHFNLAGLNVHEALSGDPDLWVGRYTAWELQQIVRVKAWLDETVFYRDGAPIAGEELAALGIMRPAHDAT